MLNTLLYVSDDPKLVEIARVIKLHKLSARGLSLRAGLNPTTVDYWLKNPSANVRYPEDVDRLLELVNKAAKKFSPLSTKKPEDALTLSNTESITSIDEVWLERIRQMELPVEFKVFLVDVSKTWSAKSAEMKVRLGKAFPALSGLAYQVTGALGNNIKHGSVLIFKAAADDYPLENIFLLFENKLDTDTKIIGWIDPAISGTRIQTMGQDFPLTDWKLTHFAFAIMWGGADGRLTENRSSDNGISTHVKP